MSNALSAVFGGQAIFGDPDSYSQVSLQHNDASAIDEFLDLTPGTTIYGADNGGHLFAITGQFLGATSDIVADQLMNLMAFTGLTATFYRLTGDICPSVSWPEENCYFTAGDIVFGTVQQLGVNRYGQVYSLILRQIPKG